MQSVSLRRATATAAQPARSRRTVRAQAWTEKGPLAGLLRFFTPNRYIESKEDWENTTHSYTGKISHDRQRKPFKDGFINKSPKDGSAPQQQQPGSPATVSDEGALSYLGQAAERVVGHNFKGDSSEPDWKQAGHTGYKGRARPHEEDGFHSKTY